MIKDETLDEYRLQVRKVLADYEKEVQSLYSKVEKIHKQIRSLNENAGGIINNINEKAKKRLLELYLINDCKKVSVVFSKKDDDFIQIDLK